MQKYIQNIQLICTFAICINSISLFAQDCAIENKTFQLGELLSYDIYYYLAGVWVPAGEVSFEVKSKKVNNSEYYHFYAYGQSHPKYDWFYRVRDTYESIVDKNTLLPLRFKRKVNEGRVHIREDYVFNSREKKVYTLRQMEEDEAYVKDSVFYSACSWDVLSIIYYARNLDFSDRKVGDKLPIKIFLDNEEHNSYIQYLGKEELEIKGKGVFECYKYSPLLIEGTIFSSGSGMVVWVTADQNNLPILIETPILVGSIKARIRSAEGLRHEQRAKIR